MQYILAYTCLITEHFDNVIMNLYFILSSSHVFHSFLKYMYSPFWIIHFLNLSTQFGRYMYPYPCLIITRICCSNCHVKFRKIAERSFLAGPTWAVEKKQTPWHAIRTIRFVVYPLKKMCLLRTVSWRIVLVKEEFSISAPASFFADRI